MCRCVCCELLVPQPLADHSGEAALTVALHCPPSLSHRLSQSHSHRHSRSRCRLSSFNLLLLLHSASAAYSLFAIANTLHPDVFPMARKMEAEIVQMVVNLFNGGPEACGVLTSGGTESILMAIKSYRCVCVVVAVSIVTFLPHTGTTHSRHCFHRRVAAAAATVASWSWSCCVLLASLFVSLPSAVLSFRSFLLSCMNVPVHACAAVSDFAAAERGVVAPEMVVPRTAHAAFDKAAHYFRIKLVHVDVDPVTFLVDTAKMAAAITKNTVVLVGSAPQYPHVCASRVYLGRICGWWSSWSSWSSWWSW